MPGKRILNIGLIGYGFMGKAHSNAWRQAPRFFDLPAEIKLQVVCGRDERRLRLAATRLGWSRIERDWRQVVADPLVDLIDICTPNNSHCEIAVAAARAGKAILCEKPLALNTAEARQMVAAVNRASVPNMVCYNYRRIPAIALAKRLIDSGELGDNIYHCRGRYAQDWIADPRFPVVWRLQPQTAGSGAVGDIFSHIVDLARYLVGELAEICATTETFIKRRPAGQNRHRGKAKQRFAAITVDDAVTAVGRFGNGALFSLEATRFAPGRKNSIVMEINGSQGSLQFDFEEMNRLKLFRQHDCDCTGGFRDVLVTESDHPYIRQWWPPGHLIGYEHTFVHTVADFVTGVFTGEPVAPDFADGLRTQRALDAAVESAHNRKWIRIRA
jgi:predicted dehydrogenase